jgi:hypothetical protein
MSEKHIIVVMQKGDGKCQSKIEATALLLHAILVVADIIALSEPSNA